MLQLQKGSVTGTTEGNQGSPTPQAMERTQGSDNQLNAGRFGSHIDDWYDFDFDEEGPQECTGIEDDDEPPDWEVLD